MLILHQANEFFKNYKHQMQEELYNSAFMAFFYS